jgi:hypothetical protein
MSQREQWGLLSVLAPQGEMIVPILVSGTVCALRYKMSNRSPDTIALEKISSLGIR